MSRARADCRSWRVSNATAIASFLTFTREVLVFIGRQDADVSRRYSAVFSSQLSYYQRLALLLYAFSSDDQDVTSALVTHGTLVDVNLQASELRGIKREVLSEFELLRG